MTTEGIPLTWLQWIILVPSALLVTALGLSAGDYFTFGPFAFVAWLVLSLLELLFVFVYADKRQPKRRSGEEK